MKTYVKILKKIKFKEFFKFSIKLTSGKTEFKFILLICKALLLEAVVILVFISLCYSFDLFTARFLLCWNAGFI